MGGPDTSRGINFQYACSIDRILDVPLYPGWQTIQLEGDEDIEDIVIVDQGGQVVFREQIKQKRDPYQWQPNEWRDVFLAFSECPDSGETRYQFTYAGSVGPNVANSVSPILTKIAHEGYGALLPLDVETLTRNLGADAVLFLQRTERRLTVLNRGSWASTEAESLRKLRRLLVRGRSLSLAEDYDLAVYERLLHEVARKSEGEVKYHRRLTREQVFDLLQIAEMPTPEQVLDVPRYARWAKALAEKWPAFVPLTLQPQTILPSILSLVVGVEKEGGPTPPKELSLLEAVEAHHQIALVGESGSGKTVSLSQVVLHMCNGLERTFSEDEAKAPVIPVYIHMAGYDRESVNELIARQFQAAGQMVSVDAVEDLASQGRLCLLLDDVDAVKTDYLPDFLSHLKQWELAHSRCSMVVTTHRPADGRALGLPAFRLLPLGQDQAQQILLLSGMRQGDALAVLNGLPADSRHLTTSPLTLFMIAYAYQKNKEQVPRSRGVLYQEVARGIAARSEEKGWVGFERSDKISLLALLAGWMQDNETYLVSPAFCSHLTNSWIDGADRPQLAHLRACDRLRLRTEIVQSGFLRLTLDGDIEFIHSTFRAYFAALTISPADLPAMMRKPSWLTSLLLWASLRDRQETDALVELLAERPLLLGQVVHERAEKRNRIALTARQVETYFVGVSEFFTRFIKQFPVLLRDSPWDTLEKEGLRVVVARSASGDYAIAWERKTGGAATVRWATSADLCEAMSTRGFGVPLPIWVIPAEIVERYHPLEVAYLWVSRALFDSLVFVGWRGGLDVVAFGQQADTHPAIALVVNRFSLYQSFASDLPAEITDQLPFYATQEYDLVIEVLEYLTPPVVRYAVAPGHEPGHISIVQGVVHDIEDAQTILKINEEGFWVFQFGKATRRASLVEVVEMGRLMMELPGNVAQSWLKKDMERCLPGFPPEVW